MVSWFTRDREELGRPWGIKEACVECVRVVAAGGRKAETVACHLRARGADQIIYGVALVARVAVPTCWRPLMILPLPYGLRMNAVVSARGIGLLVLHLVPGFALGRDQVDGLLRGDVCC